MDRSDDEDVLMLCVSADKPPCDGEFNTGDRVEEDVAIVDSVTAAPLERMQLAIVAAVAPNIIGVEALRIADENRKFFKQRELLL